MPKPQIYASTADAVADLPNGAAVMIPGFGPGTPWNLLSALHKQGASGLTVITNSAIGNPNRPHLQALIALLAEGRVRKLIAGLTVPTHPSQPSPTLELVRSGRLEVELVPQGTLAERIRAGGAGIPAFYTPTAVGTELAEGKEFRKFDGRTYLMERALFADYTLVRAWKADTAGNLVYRLAARNFNPIMAMAARHTIAEVEEPIVPAGELRPDEIHTPGVYVERMAQIPADGIFGVHRRLLTGLPGPTHTPSSGREGNENGKQRLNRDQIAAVVARYLQPNWTVNFGAGIPTLASNYLDPESGILLSAENGVFGYGPVAGEGQEDLDVVNASLDYVTLNPGAAIVHHADSFAFIRRGMVDCCVLGAFEVAADGSFANWRASNDWPRGLGSPGGAMDLGACARQLFVAMEHTTRDGKPRLVERCSLPVTAPRGVTHVMTDIAVVAVRDGHFELLEHAPGFTVEEIQAITGAPLAVSPALRMIPL